MVFGAVAGPVSQLIQEHRYRPRTSHGVSLRLRRTRVKRSLGRCYCYIKMSWGNCSVKMSSPHGDIYDEPEGVAPRWPGPGRRGGKDHQPGRCGGTADLAPTVSATQGAVSRRRGTGSAASRPWTAVAPSVAREHGWPGAGAPERRLQGLQ